MQLEENVESISEAGIESLVGLAGSVEAEMRAAVLDCTSMEKRIIVREKSSIESIEAFWPKTFLSKGFVPLNEICLHQFTTDYLDHHFWSVLHMLEHAPALTRGLSAVGGRII